MPLKSTLLYYYWHFSLPQNSDARNIDTFLDNIDTFSNIVDTFPDNIDTFPIIVDTFKKAALISTLPRYYWHFRQ